MRLFIFRAITLLIALGCWSPTAIAQVAVPEKDAPKSAIIDYLNRTLPAVEPERIILVEGQIEFNSAFIYTDTLRFDNNSTLIFSSATSESIVLVAHELILPDHPKTATISISPRVVLDGKTGSPARRTPKRRSRSSGSGDDGLPGDNGNSGEDGKTFELPTLYFVVANPSRPVGSQSGSLMNFLVTSNGIDGGRGGDGSNGQPGQHGQSGRHGSTDNFGICSSGPRGGGVGGRGGNYGPGGKGGDAGNGGRIVFIMESEFREYADDIRSQVRPGEEGRGGYHGSFGTGGSGGSRGSAPGTCSSSGYHAGRSGADGLQSPSDRAVDGNPFGEEGSVEFFGIDVLAETFANAERSHEARKIMDALKNSEW